VEVRGNADKTPDGTARGTLVCAFVRKGKNAAAVTTAIPLSFVNNGSGGWQTVSAKTAVPDGVYALFFTYQGTGSVDFKSFTLA
jgi:hypothetical protein